MQKSKKIVMSVDQLNYKVENNEILRNISFNIYENEFVGIIGPNGAGKTTLIKILLNEIKEYQGKVNIYKKIGYVPQHDYFDKSFPIKAYEIVLMGMYKEIGIFKHYKKYHKEKVHELLKLLQIDYLYDRKVGKLSGGEYQRLMLARALASNPEILILDEPEAGVDKKGELLFYKTLKELNKNMTIIMVSHDLSMVFKETNKVMCLNHSLHCHKSTADMTADDLKKIYSESLEMLVHIDKPLKVVSKND
ncbi:putative metal transport system ATP-binding protein [Tepiditoga spiralis]|uniref:Putative metal transport system ATP-binding protein n=1 Tax=Tepiditoga spiralis TaxID=2108365 RepID=A0A7G1G6Q4_9BACT|nr:metal ABC transporter ATP-binding protein [Tepiditoga spiralis]BBE30824.1 putative metal transport system ATP-binding protein [Tepiditoga spiralis]